MRNENLSSDPRPLCKEPGVVFQACNPSAVLRDGGRKIPVCFKPCVKTWVYKVFFVAFFKSLKQRMYKNTAMLTKGTLGLSAST